VSIESASQRLLDLIEKGITMVRVERFIAACREVGVVPQLSFIVGLPSTTEEELRGEIAFLKSHPMDSSSFVLMLGSPLHEQAEAAGIRIEAQQSLYETPHGVVHAPRFYFTVSEGLSPAVADAIVEAASPYPKMRPHLGEVHALLLGDTDFFDSEERPSPPMSSAEIALQMLAQEKAAGRVDGRWFLHALGCLEDQDRLEEAFHLAQGGLNAPHLSPAERDGIKLHLAAALNGQGQARAVLQLLGKNGRDPAILGEKARAWFALNEPAKALRQIKTMLSAGYEMRWIYYIQGLCYEQLNRPAKAIKSFAKAEQRDWLEPEINEAKARCLEKLNRPDTAQAEQALAGRKRAYLGEIED
jgi:tetratricopeptide (TPR) repeat protein